MTEKETEKGNTMGEIIETEKKTERERVGERTGEKSLKGHPGFRLSPRPPSHPSSFSGMTLSSVPSPHWVNRINALNNYTDIPGKSVLSGKSNSSDENPMV